MQKKNKNHVIKSGPPPVDLQRLDLIMDGDAAERKEFCDIYIRQSEATLEDLRQSFDREDNEAWKKAAHKLKGSSQTFGAAGLSALCYEAEKGFEASQEDKQNWLNEIDDVFKDVKNCIENLE